MDNKLQLKAYTEEVEGKLLAVASEEVVDRDGDVLSIDGWDLSNFKKNPVLLYLHNMGGRSLPIGKANSIGVKDVNGKRKLVFQPEFEQITEEGKLIAEFYNQGYLKAWSVGFLPKESTKLSGDGEWPPRYKYLKQELLEISAVPVPALPSAVMIDGAKHLGLDIIQVKSFLNDKLGIKVAEEPVTEGAEPEPAKEEGEAPVVDPNEPETPEVPADSEGGEEAEDKASRVISTKSESKLQQVVKMLQDVLASLTGEVDKSADTGKTIEDVYEKVEEVAETAKHLRGEVQSYKKLNDRKPDDLELLSDDDLVTVLKVMGRAIPKALEIANKKKVLKGGENK